MKTTAQINHEIKTISDYGIEQGRSETRKGKRERRKSELRVIFLRTCLLYLESDPNRSFICKQLGAVDRRIDGIKDRCLSLHKHLTGEIPRKYMKGEGIAELKLQKKHLDYILNK